MYVCVCVFIKHQTATPQVHPERLPAVHCPLSPMTASCMKQKMIGEHNDFWKDVRSYKNGTSPQVDCRKQCPPLSTTSSPEARYFSQNGIQRYLVGSPPITDDASRELPSSEKSNATCSRACIISTSITWLRTDVMSHLYAEAGASSFKAPRHQAKESESQVLGSNHRRICGTGGVLAEPDENVHQRCFATTGKRADGKGPRRTTWCGSLAVMKKSLCSSCGS